MLKPMMRSGWPLKSCDTLLMTPGVSILKKQIEHVQFSEIYYSPVVVELGLLRATHTYDTSVWQNE